VTTVDAQIFRVSCIKSFHFFAAFFSLQSTQESTMKVNVGSTDRLIRVVVGVALIAAAVTGYIGMWGYIGIVPILTGTLRFCPAYMPFGISTCRKD
jgi:cadmium resistance protein CadD (predicted permease)